MYQLCPSILAADFNCLGEQIQILEREGIQMFRAFLSECR
jgi:ribulose-phosphate 3-epimerase